MMRVNGRPRRNSSDEVVLRHGSIEQVKAASPEGRRRRPSVPIAARGGMRKKTAAPRWTQGNVEMESPEMLEKRKELRHNPSVCD